MRELDVRIHAYEVVEHGRFSNLTLACKVAVDREARVKMPDGTELPEADVRYVALVKEGTGTHG